MSASLVVAGGMVTAIMAMPRFALALPLLVLLGIFLALVNVLMQGIMQKEIAPEVQGRVFGLIGTLAMGTAPVAMLLGGLLADVLTPRVLGIGGGVTLTLVSLGVVLVFPAFRRYRETTSS